MNENEMLGDEAQNDSQEGQEQSSAIMLPLPEGVANVGEDVEVTVAGKVVKQGGKAMLAVETINGEPLPMSEDDSDKKGIQDIENALTSKLKERDQANEAEEY